MPQLNSVADQSFFRTSRLASQPDRVDRKNKIIYGAKLMQLGDLNEGDVRPWTVTQETLSQLMEFGTQSKNGLRARYTHPNMSSDGLGTHIGRWKEFRQEGDSVYADLHIADVAFTSPQGDLGTYVMDLAEEDAEAFGVSAAGAHDRESETQFARSDKGRSGEKWPIKWKSMRAADVVESPAATRGGMFDLTTPDLRNLPAQATVLLSTYFGDAEPEVVRGRINAFLDRYLANKGTSPMADEKPVEEIVEPTATPVEETQQPATETEPTADLSTDLAAVERDRCKKIRALCELAGASDKFNTFVDNNFSVAETQAALRDIVAKKSPVLSQAVAQESESSEDTKLKAEYAEMVKFKVTMGQSEADYIAHARKKTA